jgi:NADPH-dependent curcumin reductase CurA
MLRPPNSTLPLNRESLTLIPQGLFDVGQIKSGETLVVSGAAGSVGSIVCQLGKLKNAKVIAIAGSDVKCRWLVDELGVDAALNYKDPEFKKQFRDTVGYLDVYFDNVGGEILDLALTRLKVGARIALCGMLSFSCECLFVLTWKSRCHIGLQ